MYSGTPSLKIHYKNVYDTDFAEMSEGMKERETKELPMVKQKEKKRQYQYAHSQSFSMGFPFVPREPSYVDAL